MKLKMKMMITMFITKTKPLVVMFLTTFGFLILYFCKI